MVSFANFILKTCFADSSIIHTSTRQDKITCALVGNIQAWTHSMRPWRRQGAAAYVIYASSQDPDMRYLTQFVTSDPPIFFIKKRGEDGIVIVPQMEIGRAEDEAPVMPLPGGMPGSLPTSKRRSVPPDAAARMAYEYAGGDIIVPGTFPPLAMAEDIRLFCRVTVDTNTVENMREVKNPPRECDAIRTAQEQTNEVMALAESIIRHATEKDGALWHEAPPPHL